MKNFKKTALLFGLLFIPAIIYLLLTGLGESKFKRLPIFYDATNPEFDAGALNAGGCSPNFVDSTHRIPAFSFINQNGQRTTEKDFLGKITIADFFFTRCPDICITLSSQLVRVQEAFEGRDDVRILSHSVDPEYDSAQVLKEYAKRYGADEKMWTFVTGSKTEIYKQARCGYFLPVTEPKQQAAATDYIHTEKITLIDKEGRIRGYYDGTNDVEVDRLITEAQLLMEEYKED
ncbi:MAG: SCO family protein [Cytophagales bacterium]|nr:MAG: SCO family protein [Cytophagales bacterium]TAF61095.1 MAG: SCO family protein [Cytophagales bacterium]